MPKWPALTSLALGPFVPLTRMGEARHRLGFWGAAYALVVVFAFSTAPSPLYVLYARRDHFTSLTITLIYAAYAVGVIGSLLLASHLSDLHGRRPLLLAAVGLAIVSTVLFIAWPALVGLFIARALCGVSVGLTVSTATAYLSELHSRGWPTVSGGRPQLIAATANLAGLALGALVTGLLAQYMPHPLVIPYLVVLAMLILTGIGIAVAPETRSRQRPLPPYRPQHVSLPADARPQFFAAATGVFFAFAVPAVVIGLAGTFLAAVVHDHSLAMAGGTIGIVFAVAVVLTIATRTWQPKRLLATGVTLNIAGLSMLVSAAWLPNPSLALFLIAGAVIGGASAALFKGTLASAIRISPPEHLGETLSGYFLSAYLGLSVPAIAVGVALQSLTPRITLLALAIIVSAGLLGATPVLLGPPSTATPRPLTKSPGSSPGTPRPRIRGARR
jgi:MFS family permease